MSDALKHRLGQEIVEMIPRQGIIAFGSGTTVNSIIRALGMRNEEFSGAKFLSGSSLTSSELASAGLTESIYSPWMEIDVCIDGADEICMNEPNYILKGRGGALLREKVLWRASQEVIVAVTSDKIKSAISSAIPIELDPFAYPHVLKMLKFYYQDFHFELRKHATGLPFYTDGGNFIIDLFPPSGLGDPHGVAYRLKGITGVVDTGLFTDFDNVSAVIASQSSTVKQELIM